MTEHPTKYLFKPCVNYKENDKGTFRCALLIRNDCEKCNFAMTKSEAEKKQRLAAKRLSNLPRTQQRDIAEKYYQTTDLEKALKQHS